MLRQPLLALLILCLLTIGQAKGQSVSYQDLNNKELRTYYDENRATAGPWLGLPGIKDERWRPVRWEWFRQKPNIRDFDGCPSFVQFEHGAWLGHTFVIIAHPDSLMAYHNIEVADRNREALRYYIYEADRDSTTYISLEGQKLKEIPEWIYEFEHLKTLNLSGTSITHLPARLNTLDSLSSLSLDNMRYPDSIAVDKLTNITDLSAKTNGWTHCPKWITRFKVLEEVDLSKNALERIPNRIVWMRQLRTIKVSNNPIDLDHQWLVGLHKLTNLRLNSCGLTSIHPKILRLRKLTELQLSDNQITKIPAKISKLRRLESLALYKNQISEIPPEFYTLKKLRIVDFFYNNIERISPEIAQLENLEILYLANNRLFDLPESLGNLKQLKELYLHHNRLSDLPNSLASLEELKVMHINHNYFTQFPDELLSLKHLRDLDISYNEIPTIPLAVTQFSDIRFLFLIETNMDLENGPGLELKQALDALQTQGVKVGY